MSNSRFNRLKSVRIRDDVFVVTLHHSEGFLNQGVQSSIVSFETFYLFVLSHQRGFELPRSTRVF